MQVFFGHLFHVHCLIYLEGIVHGKRFFDLTPAEIEHIFKVNVFSHFWMVKRSLSSMKMSTDACIVSISSVVSNLYVITQING
jgi:short-subunit dehydrogenase